MAAAVSTETLSGCARPLPSTLNSSPSSTHLAPFASCSRPHRLAAAMVAQVWEPLLRDHLTHNLCPAVEVNPEDDMHGSLGSSINTILTTQNTHILSFRTVF
ncbi:uncharacterized protein LOC125543538 [Triticum urartu]|uniref:uncharacterized protein LOC125543538 n=1 Tax=Triticum urartu TaxID=4572 RepID=UPI002043A8CA|nr:uncharacterized protein LOC125543538 [Triticum urartu]